MKNKYFLLFVLLLVGSFSFAQVTTMPAGSGNLNVSVCSGTFVDNGGSAGNYSNSQNSTITFCPAVAGDVVQITFTSYNTEANYDYLYAYNGNSTASPLIGTFNGVMSTFTVLSTAANGCVTFKFTSDGTGQKAGWVANVSCVTPCVIPTAALVNNSDVFICPPSSITPGSLTVAFDASASTTVAAQGPLSRYEWDWGDGSAITFTPSPNTTHTFPGTGGIYIVKLFVRNSNFDIDPLGCKSTNPCQRVVSVNPPPNFAGTTAGPLTSSCGSSVNITGIAATQNYVSALPPTNSVVTNLPDGTGVSYSSGIDYSGYFAAGATVSAACYPTITFSLEHSYAYDLQFDLIAPNGQSVRFFNRHGVPPATDLNGVYHFGTCSNNADNGAYGCPATYTVVNTGGIAWTAYGTGAGQAGVLSPNVKCAPTYSGACEAGNYYKSATFTSTNPFTTLNGAPLNGVWSLKITDNTALDDGTLFSWSLAFPPTCVAREIVNPDMVSGVWSTSGSGPAPTNSPVTSSVTDPGPDPCPIAGTCLGNKITNTSSIGPFTAPGSFVYDFTVTDEYGCKYVKSVTVNVPVGPTFTVPANITQCVGSTVAIANFTSVPAGAVFTWANSNTAIGLAASGSGSVPAFTATNATAGPITATITVTATPGSGCPTIKTYTITINPAPTATFTDPPDQCLTGNSFTFTNTGSSGAGFTHSWNFGGAISNTSTATSPTGVSYAAAGTYTITHIVNDTASTCQATFTQTIVVFPSPTAIATTVVDANCSQSNGSITITGVTSGTAPYTYSVCGSAFTATTVYSGLPAGTCTVFVRDVNGCEFQKSVTILDIPGPTALAVTTVNSSCGMSNGAINIGATTGGVGPYTYSVCGSAFTATTSYPGLPAGSCTVIVKDSKGCTFTTSGNVSNNTAPTAIASTIVNANCSTANGSITLGAVTGGTAPYTYSFNNAPGAGPYTSTTSYPNLIAGSYAIEVKDASGCIFATTLTVLNNSGPTAIATTIVNANCGGSNGSITITGVTGGVAPYTYSFNVATGVGPYTATTNYTNLAAATYNIEVKDANGCLFLQPFTVINNPGPTAIATTKVDATCGLSNGSISITGVTGGNAPYTYSFNVATGVGPYTATTNYINLAAGTYNIEVKDANGCLFLTSVTIINKPGPTAIGTTIVNATCGASNGSITITGTTGGTAPYTYSFNVAPGAGPYNATPTSFTGLAAGVYNIEVNDANGCKFPTSVTIINNPGPTAIATTIVNANCGASNGSITITGVTGGTAPYTYSFNVASGVGPYTATTSYTNLAAATYNIEVKDANGCLFLQPFTVINNPGPTAITTTIVNSSCGAADGCVTITGVTGGTAPYTYSFNNPGVFTATTNYCGLVAGSYPVEVKDVNGCIYMVTVNVIDNLGPTAIATTFVNPSCGQADGSITITGVTGGTAPYTYDFGNPADTVFDNGVNNTGLVAGTYTIAVKDVNGCTFTTTVTIVDNAGPTAIATTLVNSNCGAADGCVTIGAVTGGLAPYTYSFNSPAAYGTTTNYCGLLAGSYSIYVKDANGCVFMTTITIIDNPGPTAIATTITNSSCGIANGCVDITGVTGGTSPYLYSFNGSAFTTTTNYCSLIAGSYTVEVQDINGCEFLVTVTIIDTPGPTAITSTVVDAACGASNGSITITGVTGGVAPYTYALPAPGAFTAQTSYPGLPAGSYPVDVKDANGCIYSTVISINNAGGPTAVVVTHTDTSCGASNGTVNIGAVTGGTSPYTYSFNNPAGAGPYIAQTSYTGLAAGTYAIEVKDASGCIFATSVVILNNAGPTAIATTVVDATCGASNGSVDITGVTGGTAPYQYSFNIPTGGPYNSTTSFTGLAPGNYNVEVQDANGCKFLKTVTIIDKPGPTAVATVINDTTCGAMNGSVTFGAVTGGTAPYTFSFNNSPYTTTTVYSGLSAGTYPIGVTGANGCIFTSTITINDLPGPTAIATTIVNESCGASDGSITITGVTGGVGPYTYYLDNPPYGAATSFTGLVAGSYILSVRDANGCIFTETVTITNAGGPTAIATTIVNETCSGSNGSVNLGAVTGGVAPYMYQFGTLPYGSGTSYTGLPAGIYPLNVKDVNGCIYSTTITIINSPSVTDIAVTTTDETCTSANGTITLGAVTGGTAPYTYSVCGSSSSSQTVYTGLSAGTCTITVTDATGCIYTETVTINDSPGPTDIATTVVNETCTSGNGSITLGLVTGGTGPYTYTFNGVASGSATVYSNLSAGSYTFIVTDANGCTYTEIVPVTDAPGPTAIASTITNATCGVSNGCVNFGAVTGGTAPYQINFENLGYSATTNYCGLGAGPHSFDIKDANGCIFSSIININNIGGATGIATTLGNASCGLSNGTITIDSVTGGTAPYEYSLDNGPYSSATFYNNLAPGVHSITVKGANGCIYSDNVTIIDQPGPTAVATTIVDSTCGNPNGSITFGAVTGGTSPYTYTVTAGNSGSYVSGTTFNGLAAGPYLIGVKDVNGCTFTQSVTITTTTAPTANISYANAPFCNSDSSIKVVTLTGTGSYTGGGYASSPAGLIISASNGDITPAGSTPGTYTITYTVPPAPGCPPITATTSITIDPVLTPTITCGATSTTSVQFNWNAVTGATGYTVSYTVNGTPTFPATPIGNVTTYTVNTNPNDIVTITVMPTGGFGTCFGSSTLSCTANNCVASSATISYATPFCDNNNTPQAVTLSGAGNYTGGTFSVSPTTGLFINPTTGDITPSVAGSYTVTYTLAASGGCPAVTDDTIVVVTPLPTATINYAGSPYCSSIGTPQAVTLNGTGAYTGGTFTANPAGLTINSTTGAITPSSPTVPGTYTVTYTIPASGGCPTVPVTTSVTITQQPSATISYAGSPFCVSDTSPKVVTITGAGAYTGGVYSNSTGLIIDSATGTITGGTVGTHTVTYTIPASAGCGVETATTTVTVNPLPVASATPSTSTICSGATTNIALTSDIPGTTFTWTVVESAPSGAANGGGNSINQTLTITGSTAATVTYTITPAANGCVGNTFTATVTVNPSPNVVATPSVQTICSGQTTGIVLTSSTPGATFTWTINPTDVSGASNGSGNFISQVLNATNPTIIGTVVYTITPTGSNCSGTPINVTVYVTPPPVATATPSGRTICSGESTNIVLTSSIPGTVFNWNVIASSVSGSSNGTGNIIDQVLTTVGSNQGKATYAITPVTNGCPGETIFVDVIVNPIPVATANPTSESICSGSTTAISLSSDIAATTYSWTVITSGVVFGASSGSGDFIGQTLTVLGSTSGFVDYTITPFANGCSGNPIVVRVVVRPTPEVFGSSQVTICSEESPNITLFPSIPGTTFTWTYTAIGVSGAANGTGDIIDQDLTATGTTAGTVVYTVTPTANGCTGTPSDFTVTVNPLPTPDLKDGIICVDAAGNTFKSYKFETGFNNADYDFVWYYNDGTTTTTINGASSSSYDAFEVGTYSVQVTNTITGCVSPLVSAIVTASNPATNITVTTSSAFSNNATITVLPAGYLYSLDEGSVQEENIFSNLTPGVHSVTITDINGCTNETITVFIIGYPHYFTPNGDGINDNWNIIGLNGDSNAKIYIFDRYGKLIKQISPTGEGWDGTYNGEQLPSTDYWFTVEYIELGAGKLFNSHFSLKR